MLFLLREELSLTLEDAVGQESCDLLLLKLWRFDMKAYVRVAEGCVNQMIDLFYNFCRLAP
jgi:hypothetical protein